MSINGTETSGPTRLGNPIVDIATGLFSAIAILMALHDGCAARRIARWTSW
jgi:formyl-CoA transferase